MRLTFSDKIFANLYILITCALSVLLTILLNKFFSAPIEYKGILNIFFFLLFFFLLSGGLLKFTHAIFPLKEGWFSMEERRVTLWKLEGLIYDILQNFYIHLFPKSFRKPLYSILGVKIGKNVMLCGTVVEPSLIEIGDDSILGEETIITGHLIEKNKIFLGKVVIGENVTIGGKAGIMPNVRIGDNSIVTASSIVMMGTEIPCDEVWGGNPARRRKRLNNSL